MFKTPTLRNVAFYTTRELSHVDLPRRYQDNLDVQAPFDRRAGDPPALSDAEIADIVAFLYTLTDGYSCAAARIPC